MENWRQEYNNYRPHSSLDYLTPAEFARQYYEKNQEKEAMQPRQVAARRKYTPEEKVVSPSVAGETIQH